MKMVKERAASDVDRGNMTRLHPLGRDRLPEDACDRR